jgi:hypothetical protein
MEITVTDSGIDEFGGVWVIGRGPGNQTDAIRRKIAAYSRRHGYGRWVSAGGTFGPDIAEWRVRYHPKR